MCPIAAGFVGKKLLYALTLSRPYSLELCLTFRISFINHVISSKICKNHRKSYSTMSDIQHDKVWSPKN